jgi:hypothetical protein
MGKRAFLSSVFGVIVLAAVFLLGHQTIHGRKFNADISVAYDLIVAQTRSLKDEIAAINYNNVPSISPGAPSVGVQGVILASSSAGVFANPHGTLMIGDKIVIGTVKENPAHIVIFANPADLAKYVATTTPGFFNLAEADYDAGRHRIYFVASRTDNKHLEILSVDPETLAWTPVFEFADAANIGYSTIKNDGTYVYAATESIPAYMIKVRISDWSLQAVHGFPLGPKFHSSALHIYSDRTEWYVNSFSVPTAFFKVKGDDFSYVSTILAESGNATDDGYFLPIDEKGGLFYETSESTFGINVVDTANMFSTHYEAPGSYGLFPDGADLISLNARDHRIVRYQNFQMEEPAVIKFSLSHHPNEWFKTSNGDTYFTDFGDPSALYRYSVRRNKK